MSHEQSDNASSKKRAFQRVFRLSAGVVLIGAVGSVVSSVDSMVNAERTVHSHELGHTITQAEDLESEADSKLAFALTLGVLANGAYWLSRNEPNSLSPSSDMPQTYELSCFTKCNATTPDNEYPYSPETLERLQFNQIVSNF